jgi:hypothetical protein
MTTQTRSSVELVDALCDLSHRLDWEVTLDVVAALSEVVEPNGHAIDGAAPFADHDLALLTELSKGVSMPFLSESGADTSSSSRQPHAAERRIQAGPSGQGENDKTLLELLRTAEQQQQTAIKLSQEAARSPQDADARHRAGQAWQESETRWRAVAAHELEGQVRRTGT